MSLEELQKMRPVITKMLQKVTGGEINDFDFIVDFLSHNRGNPKITLLFSVPGRVKKQYDGDMDKLMDNHFKSITEVLKTVGFGKLINTSLSYQVL